MIKNFLKKLADRFYKILDEETKEHEEELMKFLKYKESLEKGGDNEISGIC